MQSVMLYPAVNGAHTELYAGWSPDIGIAQTGCFVMPWGRIGHVRHDVEAAGKTADQGGTALAGRFWHWCEQETGAY